MQRRHLALVLAYVMILILIVSGIIFCVKRSGIAIRRIAHAFHLDKIMGMSDRMIASRHIRKATRYMRGGDFKRAKAHLQRALKLDPKNYVAYRFLIILYIREDNQRDLNAILQRAESALPKSQASYLYTEVGDYYAYQGVPRLPLAERYYERAIQLDPNNATALNNYGYTLADNGRQLNKAEKLIKKAVELEKNNAAFIDSMGWVYYKQGRYDEALKWLKKAVKLEPNDAELRYHLGMVYIALNRLEEARAQLEKAIRLNPNHIGAQRALNELEQLKKHQRRLRPHEMAYHKTKCNPTVGLLLALIES